MNAEVGRAAEADDAVTKIQWKLKAGIEAGSLVIIKKVLPNDLPEYCVIGRAVDPAARIIGSMKSSREHYGTTVDDAWGAEVRSDRARGHHKPRVRYPLDVPTRPAKPRSPIPLMAPRRQ